VEKDVIKQAIEKNKTIKWANKINLSICYLCRYRVNNRCESNVVSPKAFSNGTWMRWCPGFHSNDGSK